MLGSGVSAFGQPCVYIASAPWHVELITARLLIYSIKPHHVDQSKSHGNNVHDVIIVQSVDAQTNRHTDTEEDQPGAGEAYAWLLIFHQVLTEWLTYDCM